MSSSNIQATANLEKDTILPVDYYAKTFFDTVKQKYPDMLELYQMNKESIVSKQKYFRIESQIMMTRIQKFTSHMLIDAQREMHKNIDNH